MSDESERNPNYPWARLHKGNPEERAQIKKLVLGRNLVGLANDTKWDEFLAAMRPLAEGQRAWRFSYRYKTLEGRRSEWDCEWFYHVPFSLNLEWFDVAFLEERQNKHIPPKVEVIDHSPWLEETLQKIGLDYRKGNSLVRIFLYAPRDLEGLDEI